MLVEGFVKVAECPFLTKLRHMLNEKQELDFNVYLLIANLQLNIIS